jgi:hypothetical protein
MEGETLEADNADVISGEVEVEKVQTHNIESRSKNLIPVFDSLHTSRFQQTRYIQIVHLSTFVSG